MLSTNIYPLCWVSHYLFWCSSTEGLSSQERSPLISGVARSCCSLTTHETFSHVHNRLNLNVQQLVSLCVQKWLQECSQISETILWCWGPWLMTTKPPTWQTYQQSNRTLSFGPSGCLDQQKSQWYIKPPGRLTRTNIRAIIYNQSTSRTTAGPLDHWTSRTTDRQLDLQDNWWTTGPTGQPIDDWDSRTTDGLIKSKKLIGWWTAKPSGQLMDTWALV